MAPLLTHEGPPCDEARVSLGPANHVLVVTVIQGDLSAQRRAQAVLEADLGMIGSFRLL
jgi:hypothetical protein